MEHKVVPFIASISHKQGVDSVASQLQALINQQSTDGWEYVGLGTVNTFIAGSSGCFGIGSTPSSSASFSLAVFRR
jgi:hypothetical protein